MSLSYAFFQRSFFAKARPIATAFYPAALRSSPTVFPMAPAKRKSSSNAPKGYTEDWDKGAMLRFEDSLPQLPVPTLEETARRYLKSVHPLLSSSEYEHTKKAVEEFVKSGGQGEQLQKRLVARAEDPNVKNWLYEWWNHVAYLGDRGPVVPFVSYFYAHRDDRKRRDPATRAAAITTAVLEFKKQVDDGSLEPEYMRKEPIAMSSYWWMFNACRIPDKNADFPVKYSYKENPYLIAIRKNQFYKIAHEIDGKQLTTAELEQQFRRVINSATKVSPVGALTSERRSEWVDMRERLINASPGNKTALETIEASSFAICLDDASPVTRAERARSFWHGDGCNRWYDKPLQFIVNDNGVSGFQGEHSMMDGTPTHRLNDYVMSMIFNNKLDFSNPDVRSNLPDPAPIKFVLNEEVEKDIAAAQTFHNTTIAEHDLVVEAFQGYGKGFMKKAKCSPDAYVQMIIQLGYRKMYGKNRPTYESAATRKFQQGRTETCRSVSDDSVAFCDAMEDPNVDDKTCADLLRTAIKSHVAYIGDASEGRGVDRHLFGLKKLIKDGEPVPEIFKDPAYTYSCTWFISSSQLSSEFFNGYGWSQVVDDGWGIAYMINENSINFNIVSKRLGNEHMAYYLNEAAERMRDILVATMDDKDKAKL